MNWLESLSPKKSPNLSNREQTIEYFSMYRGKGKKLLHSTRNFKVLQIQDMLLIEVNPIMGTNIIFLEDDEGTKIVLAREGQELQTFIHPFIKPSMIVNKGGLIPDVFKTEFKSKIEKEFDITFYDEKEYKALNAVEKVYYVEKTWDLSHTIAYTLLI